MYDNNNTIDDYVQNALENIDIDKENGVETGTTTIGIEADDGVAVLSDRKASLQGRYTVSKSVDKINQVHPNGVLTLVGSVGGAQLLAEVLERHVDLFRNQRGKHMTIEQLASKTKFLIQRNRLGIINPIVAGYDDHHGSQVYSVDPNGGVLQNDPYVVNGSGMQVAHGVLEQSYTADVSLDEAVRMGAKAVRAASERDSGSGDGLVACRIETDGTVTKNRYDGYDVIDETSLGDIFGSDDPI